MVDPHNITKYDRTHAELEEFLLNAIAFAGKNAVQQSKKMHDLIGDKNVSPFALIRRWKKEQRLMRNLQHSRIGKYRLLAESFSSLAHSDIDLSTCSVEHLQAFRGIGPKTARFFLLHSRPHQELVVIDTHMLKEMRQLGFTKLRATPAGKRYEELEKRYLLHLKRRGITDLAAHDLDTWKKYSRKGTA